MAPYFSVLVPACNMAGKMTDCINSLKGQTFEDFEVIMVDDGSKDDTYNELLSYSSEDKRFITLKHEQNSSLLAARYTAMKVAQGKVIVFLDSDDYIEKDALEVLNGYFENNDTDIVRFGYRTEPEGIDFLPPASDDPLRSIMEGKIPPAIWKNAYRISVIKKVLERTDSFYCNMGEDVYFAGVLFSCADSFGTINKVLHHYLIAEGMSNSYKDVSIAKIERDLKSVNASGDNLLRFIEKYAPERLTLAQNAVRTMKRFVLTQNVLKEPDYAKIVERLAVFDTEELRPIYEWGCRKFLPYLLESRLRKDELSMEERRANYNKVMQEDESI